MTSRKSTVRRYAFLVLMALAQICAGEGVGQPRGFVAFGFGGLETMPVDDVVDLLMSPDNMSPEQAERVCTHYLESIFPRHFTRGGA